VSRSTFRFTIRSLLVFVFIAAVCCWYVERVISRQRFVNGIVTQLLERGAKVESKPQPPFWWFGDPQYFSAPREINLVTGSAQDNDLELIQKLPSVIRVSVSGEISDDGLKHLASMSSLIAVNVQSESITDDGLCQLAALENLEDLMVGSDRIKGTFVKCLTPCQKMFWFVVSAPSFDDDAARDLVEAWPNIHKLDLLGTGVTDKSVPYLASLKNLYEIDLRYTEVSDAGIEQLEKARPGLMILDSPR
jgi:hypothetical protein